MVPLNLTTGEFYLTVSEPTPGLVVDSSKASFTLLLSDGEALSSGFLVKVLQVDDLILKGTVTSQRLPQAGRLIISAAAVVDPYLYSQHAYFDPSQPIVIPVGVPAQDAKIFTSTAATVIVGAAAVGSALSASAGGGGSQFAALLKMLDSVEFLLYLDGLRINKANFNPQFIKTPAKHFVHSVALMSHCWQLEGQARAEVELIAV